MRAVDTNVLVRLVQDADAVAAAVGQFRRRPAVGFFDRDLGKIEGAHRL